MDASLGGCAQQFRSHLKILYMTGCSRNAVVHQGRLDEGVNWLEKPISLIAVQVHERQAWIDHVLANPAGPNIKAYSKAGLTGAI